MVTMWRRIVGKKVAIVEHCVSIHWVVDVDVKGLSSRFLTLTPPGVVEKVSGATDRVGSIEKIGRSRMLAITDRERRIGGWFELRIAERSRGRSFNREGIPAIFSAKFQKNNELMFCPSALFSSLQKTARV